MEKEPTTTKRRTLREEKWRREREKLLAVQRQDLERHRNSIEGLLERVQRVMSEIDKLDGRWEMASTALVDDAVLLSCLYLFLPLNIDIKSTTATCGREISASGWTDRRHCRA